MPSLQFRRRGLIAIVAVALVATGGLAYAAIPDTGGVVHSCYTRSTGAWRVIDPGASQACRAKESPLDLYSKGGSDLTFLAKTGKAADSDRLDGLDSAELLNRAGLGDSFVATRFTNQAIVPSTSEFTQILTLRLEPGSYQVTGKLGLHNRNVQLPFRVQCALVPSNTDGTAREPGAFGSDWGFLHLAPGGQPGGEDQIALFVSQELSQAGSVVLGCSGDGNEVGAFTNYVSIRATEVSSINSIGR